jgi:hypothetical protein
MNDRSCLLLGAKLLGLAALAGCGSSNNTAIPGTDSGGTTPADSAPGTDSGDSTAADSAPGPDSAVPADFALLCERTACPCQSGSSPPHLVGSYVGQGTTKETSNSLWALDSSAQVVVHVVSQPGDGTITGTAQILDSSDASASDSGAMPFVLQLTPASILGSGSNFTIYGTDLEDTGSGCKHGVRVVLSGTASTGSTINGCMALVFTSETQGSACTASEIANYPGTGATFQYDVTLVDAQ